MPLLESAEEVFQRDDKPFLERIAEHRIPVDCTPQQLSSHLTFIDARWRTLALRPLPPARHMPSALSSKAASPSSSALVNQLAKRQLLGKLIQLPDMDAFKGQLPIASCASAGPLALRCSPMHHVQTCKDPMFCQANRAVSMSFSYPNHTTNLRDQFDLRESLRDSSAVEEAVPAAKALKAKRPTSSAASALGASAASALGASAASAPRKRASSAAPKSTGSKKPKQGGSKTRKSKSRRRFRR